MKLPEAEQAAHKEAFARMSWAEKAEYIFAYYKLPLVIGLVVAVALGWIGLRACTYKEPVLYLGYANVALDEPLEQAIEADFLAEIGADPLRSEVVAYRNLYLANVPEEAADHQLAYASKLKLFAAIEGQQLDAVIMNREAYNLLSGSGYLLDLEKALAGSELQAKLTPQLVSNKVITSDNAVEYQLGEAGKYEAEFEEQVNAIDVSSSSAFDEVQLSDKLYLGVIANSPRSEQALALAKMLL